MKSTLVAALAISLTASLTGCGGGSSAPPDNTAAYQQTVSNIAYKLPAPKVYTGAFCAIENIPAGFISGPDERSVVLALVKPIVDTPAKYPEAYKLLLSDKGLSVTLYGESLPPSSLGLAQHAPDSLYTVTLRVDGLHVVKNN